jgi:hypothetical protein
MNGRGGIRGCKGKRGAEEKREGDSEDDGRSIISISALHSAPTRNPYRRHSSPLL